MWIIADPPWHIDAVGGRSHHQSHAVPPLPHDADGLLIAEIDLTKVRPYFDPDPLEPLPAV
ncbi:hypothetical protein MASR1M49_42470 [Pararhodobacter aggregans]